MCISQINKWHKQVVNLLLMLSVEKSNGFVCTSATRLYKQSYLKYYIMHARK